PWTDYGSIVLIALAITGVGLLEGVGVGMLVMLVFFAVRLSRVDPVASQFSLHERRSKRTRPVPERTILLSEGKRALACELRGYLFFGSVSPLIERLGRMLDATSRPACLALDFAQVSGVDFSAANTLARYIHRTQTAGVQVVLSAVTPELLTRLERNLQPEVFADVATEADLDRALERCEDHLIASWRASAEGDDERRSLLLGQTATDIQRHLERQIEFEELLELLAPWTEARESVAGEQLTSLTSDLQLLVEGKASALAPDGERQRQFGAGDAIWPDNAGAATRIVAEGPCRTVSLGAKARQRLEEQDAALSLRLYRYLLATRLD
ncbi:MAG: STAS domain-containing protein, partial [Gammaproteobacteria bacterium]|nr:STAS domain-containing protein [Gammaproteobacteria bacterium]